MKLYVVIRGWDYEGFDEPIGVFDDKELAEKAKISYKHYDFKEILEYDLNVNKKEKQ